MAPRSFSLDVGRPFRGSAPFPLDMRTLALSPTSLTFSRSGPRPPPLSIPHSRWSTAGIRGELRREGSSLFFLRPPAPFLSPPPPADGTGPPLPPLWRLTLAKNWPCPKRVLARKLPFCSPTARLGLRVSFFPEIQFCGGTGMYLGRQFFFSSDAPGPKSTLWVHL